MLNNMMGQKMAALSANVKRFILSFRKAQLGQNLATMAEKMVVKTPMSAESYWATTTMLKSDWRCLERCVCDPCGLQPCGEGRRNSGGKGALVKGKTDETESGAFFCHVVPR